MATKTKEEIESLYLTTSGQWSNNTSWLFTMPHLIAGIKNLLDTVF